MPIASAVVAASVCLVAAVQNPGQTAARPSASLAARAGVVARPVINAEPVGLRPLPFESILDAAARNEPVNIDLGAAAFDLEPASVSITGFTGARTVRGSLRGETGHFLFSEVGGAVTGAVWSDRGVYEVRPADEPMAVRVIDLGRAALPGCVELREGGEPEDAAVGAPALRGEPEQVTRVLVAFTDAGAAQVGGQSQVLSFASAAIESANTAYDNSLMTVGDEGAVACRLELVGVWTGDPQGFTGSGLLGAVRSPADGVMDEVNALRDATGADLVAIISESGIGICGVAYLAPESQGSGFSVTAQSCAIGNLTFAHELGHNQGATHDVDNAGGSYRPYGFGWRWTTTGGSLRRSVMAYSPGSRRPNFSNPEVLNGGVPTGVAGAADNARLIGETFPGLASFRSGGTDASVDCDNDGTGDVFQLVSDPATDSDASGALDACELAQGLLEDCNQDGLADIGQATPRVVIDAPIIDLESSLALPLSTTLSDAPEAFSDVRLIVRAGADLGGGSETIGLSINGDGFDSYFANAGPDCAGVEATVVLPAEYWNALGADITFDVTYTPDVNPELCRTNAVRITADYNTIDRSFDSDGDGLIDACGGCSPADLAPPAGTLDLADLNAFVAGFVASDPIADLDGNGVWELADITAFVSAFNAGCP
jgi:hypothetical protein